MSYFRVNGVYGGRIAEVVWTDGTLSGDQGWVGAALAAVEEDLVVSLPGIWYAEADMSDPAGALATVLTVSDERGTCDVEGDTPVDEAPGTDEETVPQ